MQYTWATYDQWNNFVNHPSVGGFGSSMPSQTERNEGSSQVLLDFLACYKMLLSEKKAAPSNKELVAAMKVKGYQLSRNQVAALRKQLPKELGAKRGL
jgi:hypothetical protein